LACRDPVVSSLICHVRVSTINIKPSSEDAA
jgi:hypothetical protein